MKTKPTSKKVSKKTKSPKPVVAAVPEPAPVAVPVKVEPKLTTVDATDSLFNDIQAQLSALADAGVQLPGLKKGLISLKKSLDKERREAAKALPKKRVKSTSSAPRAPSGFAKPAAISKELAKFIGEKPDALVARTTVTRFITSYVKEHNLQNPENKRHIIPDASLTKLLKVSGNDPATGKPHEITYFNLQRYLKTHYPAPKKVQVAA